MLVRQRSCRKERWLHEIGVIGGEQGFERAAFRIPGLQLVVRLRIRPPRCNEGTRRCYNDTVRVLSRGGVQVNFMSERRGKSSQSLCADEHDVASRGLLTGLPLRA